jgi:hypothetical protein
VVACSSKYKVSFYSIPEWVLNEKQENNGATFDKGCHVFKKTVMSERNLQQSRTHGLFSKFLALHTANAFDRFKQNFEQEIQSIIVPF